MTGAWPDLAGQGTRQIVDQVHTLADYDYWLKTRRSGIGGSDIGGVAGVSGAWTSRYKVWLDKTGRLPIEPDNNQLERGRRFEPVIAQWFADRTGIAVRRTGTWARTDYDWMRATPDRLTFDGGLLEIKRVSEDRGHLWTDGPARHALVQVLWYMAVFPEIDHCWIAASMEIEPWFAYWRIERDAYGDAIDWLVEQAAAFWYDHVLPDIPPPVDASEATTKAIKAAYATVRAPEEWSARIPDLAQIVARRRALKAQIKSCETELARLDNELTAAIGDAEIAEDAATGRQLIAWVARTRNNKPREASVSRYRQIKEL